VGAARLWAGTLSGATGTRGPRPRERGCPVPIVLVRHAQPESDLAQPPALWPLSDAGRAAVAEVGGATDRFAGQDDEPRVEGRDVDDDRVEPLADLERDRLPILLEGLPAAPGEQLEPRPAPDEGSVGGVFEVALAVNPSVDPDVSGDPRLGEGDGVGDADPGGDRQESPDPVAVTEAADDDGCRDEAANTGADEKEGIHASIICRLLGAAGTGVKQNGPEGTYPTREL